MKAALTKQYWQKFLSILQSNDEKASLESLFQFILTHDEREMIATRLALTEELLAKEKSQRQIAADLELSIALITRCSNELKRTSEEDIAAIKDLLKS